MLRRALILFCLLWATAGVAETASRCAFQSLPEVVLDQPHEWVGVWSLAGDLEPMAQFVMPSSSAFSSWLDWIRSSGASLDQRRLLQRQRMIYSGMGIVEETRIFDLILNGSAGRIEPVNCLEALLLAEQEARFPSRKAATEFQALVMERGEGGAKQLRVYFASGDLAGMAPLLDPILDRVRGDLALGWKARGHLHNHPFIFLPGQDDIAGTAIPSATDAESYVWYGKEFGIAEARITNGVSTLVIPSGQFSLFAR
jgi:hypothetical protein